MPELTVTESQQETLEEIRAELAAEYVDTYGHVRTTDVVQYLLDTYTPPGEQDSGAAYDRIATAEFPLLQQVATDVEGVPGSGIDAETMRGELLSTLGAAEFATRLADIEEDGTAGNDAETAGTESEETTDDQSPAAGGEAEDGGTADDGAGDGAADDSDQDAEASGSEPAAGGPGAVLSAANKLLSDHDDKWRKGGGEEPYEVDLPDGTTEAVRTKDDVKQLLFKHY